LNLTVDKALRSLGFIRAAQGGDPFVDGFPAEATPLLGLDDLTGKENTQ
jgi:hypothetical protein